MSKHPKIQSESKGVSRTCLISFAHAEKNLTRCVGYECEDVVCQIDHPDLWYLEPIASYPVGKRVANRLIRHFDPAHVLNPGVQRNKLHKTYDLCVVVCQQFTDLPALNAIQDLHQKCGVSVCWLEEAWVGELHKYQGHMRLLSKFDYLFTSCSQSATSIQEATGRPCVYLPPGIDTLRFCPYPNPPHRSIDVYSMGRRSESTHKALLKLARFKNFLYIYDTVVTKDTETPLEHRDLIANLCKRAKFFIANTAKINYAKETHCQAEVGYRFFEGAASGTIMIGQAPDNPIFEQLFPWQDAVIHLPFGSTEIESLLETLNSQRQRIEALRKKGIAHSLREHDWAYRWQTILKTVGLRPTEMHDLRIQQLHTLAEEVEVPATSRKASDTLATAHLSMS